MNNKNIKNGQAEELRRRAEAIADKTPSGNGILSPAETQKLIHELCVHQLELQMQNEELRHSHASLDTARARYFDIYDLAPVGYCTISEKGLIQEINLTGATMLGQTRLALTRQLFTQSIFKEDQDIYYKYRKQLIEHGDAPPCELRMLKKGGTVFWVQLITTATQDNCGNRVFRIVIVNISEWKRTEAALRESEAFLNETQQIAELGTYVLDIPSGKWTCSEMLYTIMGIKADFDKSVEGWISILHPEWQKVMADYLLKEVIGNKIRFDKEYKIIRQNDRAERWVHGIGTLRFNDKNQPVSLVGTIRDITEHKRSEEKLQQNLNLLRLAGEVAKFGGWSVYLHDKRVVWSDEVAAIHDMPSGSTPTIAEGINFYAPEWREKITKVFTDCAQKGIPFTEEMEIITAKGRRIWVEVIGQAFKDGSGAITEVKGAFHDISERKKAKQEIMAKNEELLKQNADKDKFFSIIAHDLRSPLGTFMGLTQALIKVLPDMPVAQIQDIAVNMKNSAANIYCLLEDLLNWARMQQGLIPFSPCSVQLRLMADSIITQTLESAQRKNIQIVDEIPENLAVSVDINMLKTVIRNLISNALKFTPPNGTISLSAEVIDSPKVKVAIRDSGVGMSREILDNLFRLNARTSRKGTGGELGSGIGLLLCKEFIEKHGGEIWAESEAGQGSVFYFTLPSGAAVIKPAAATAETPIRPLNILIVEDDDQAALLLAGEVGKFGKEILTAKTGAESVAICRDHPELDLVLMDIEMPEMNGYAAAGQIRKFNQQVVIIAQTAYALTDDKAKALAAGCNDYIVKSLPNNELLALLKKYF